MEVSVKVGKDILVAVVFQVSLITILLKEDVRITVSKPVSLWHVSLSSLRLPLLPFTAPGHRSRQT